LIDLDSPETEMAAWKTLRRLNSTIFTVCAAAELVLTPNRVSAGIAA
jgi:hypothetical protein